jgi:hypothetical protein
MLRFLFLCVLLTTVLPAQGGSYGNFAWTGQASIIVRNGRPHFVLLGYGPPTDILRWNGAPSVQLRAVEAGILDNRSCIVGTTLYLHETDSLDSTYDARFGPFGTTGLVILPHDASGSSWLPPQQPNLWQYSLTFCTIWDPSSWTYQGPCGEGPSCGTVQPQAWAVIFEIM